MWYFSYSAFWLIRQWGEAIAPSPPTLATLLKAMFNDRTSRFLICKKLPIYKTFSRVNNTMFDNLQEILQSHSFLMSRKFKTQRKE